VASLLSLLIAGGCWAAIAVLYGLLRGGWVRLPAKLTSTRLFAKAAPTLERARGAFLVLPTHAAALFMIAAAASLSYGLRMLGWYVLLLAAGAEAPFIALVVLAPFVTIGAALPISVAGYGGLQAVYVFALASWGVLPDQAMVVSLLHSSLYIALNAAGSLTFLSSARVDEAQALTAERT
jgi:hypothetical protein